MAVSVIIPAYNAAGTIGRAVRSVLAQACRPVEILVIDDGSRDDIADVLTVFGDAVTLVHKSNGGAASARNLGLDRAGGEWVAFLDADDYWEPDKLQKQLAVLERHPDVDVIGCRWFDQPIAGPRQLAGVDHPEFFGKRIIPNGADAFHAATCIWTTTVLARRAALAGRRFVSGLEPAEDRDLWVRLVAGSPLYLLPEPLATYVETPGSLCRTNVDRDYGNMMKVIGRCAGLLGAKRQRREQTILFRKWAAAHLAAGSPTAALRPAVRRLAREPLSAQAWWVFLKAAVLSVRSRIRPH